MTDERMHTADPIGPVHEALDEEVRWIDVLVAGYPDGCEIWVTRLKTGETLYHAAQSYHDGTGWAGYAHDTLEAAEQDLLEALNGDATYRAIEDMATPIRSGARLVPRKHREKCRGTHDCSYDSRPWARYRIIYEVEHPEHGSHRRTGPRCEKCAEQWAKRHDLPFPPMRLQLRK